MFALLAPLSAFVMLEALSRWDKKYQHSKALEELQKRSAEAAADAAALSKADLQENQSLQTLQRRIEALEQKQQLHRDNQGARQLLLGQGAEVPVAPAAVAVAAEAPGRESSMQRRRREKAERK